MTVVKDDKIFELRKDISTPGGYWRAGTRKTKKEWVELFNIASYLFDHKNYNEWFIDPLEVIEEFELDDLSKIVNEVFGRKELRSISYKDAAKEVARIYLKLHTSKSVKKEVAGNQSGSL